MKSEIKNQEAMEKIEKVVAVLKQDRVEPSPFLFNRIKASLNEVHQAALPRPLSRWLPISMVGAAMVVLFLLVTPWSGGVHETTQVNIDYANLNEYSLANPDTIIAFVENPTEENAYQIYESLYQYSQENDLDKDLDEVYDNYKYLISNAEYFI